MRALLVCLLGALAVSAAVNSPQPFKGQRSYIYRFDSQVSSSLVNNNGQQVQQQAATRLRADVHITFTSERQARLQLQHVRIGELNAEVPTTQRVQPIDNFDRTEIPQQLRQQLEAPFLAQINDGVIVHIKFAEPLTGVDAAFAKNIQRAVLNVMQLNLKKNDVQGLKMTIDEEEKDKNAALFTIPEITLEGACATTYVLSKPANYEQESEERAQFNVTKTINFARCQQTADVAYGYQANPAQNLKCRKCMQQQQKSLDADAQEKARFQYCQAECRPNTANEAQDIEKSTFVRYELQGKLERYAIKRAQMVSQYIVKAQSPETQNAVTQIVSLAELTFKEEVAGEKLVPAFKEQSQEETLLYDAAWDKTEKKWYMSGDEEYAQASPFKRVPKKEQKVSHALRQILQQWGNKASGYEAQSAPMHFNRIVQLIRESSVQELRKIEEVTRAAGSEEQSQEQQQEHARSIFHDALAVAATRNSLHVLAEKIVKTEMTPTEAVKALQLFMANQHSPSEAQATILERLAKHEVAHRNAALKQTTWLSFGAAVGAICQQKPAEGQQKLFRQAELCSRSKRDQFRQSLVQLWREARDTYEQVLALKAIGNAAIDTTIEELQKIVMDKRVAVVVRMEAVDAMRRLRTSAAKQIQAILLPIYQQREMPVELRAAAFSMLLTTQPDNAMLDMIVGSTLNERSQSLKSFVVSALEALSRSPVVAEQEAASHLKAALVTMKMDADELKASRKLRVPIYTSEPASTEENHLFLGLASIVSPSSMIPVHLSASLRSAFNGEAAQESMQLSFTQKNIEQWLRKLSQAYNLEQEDFEQDDQSDDSQRRSAKDLRSIYQSLGMKSRRNSRSGSYFISEESEEMDNGRQGARDAQKPFAMFVMRVAEIDMAVVPMTEEHMPAVVRKMLEGEKPSMEEFEQLSRQLTSQQRMQKHAALTLGEKKTKVPTSAGLPLALMRQTTIVTSAEAQMKTQFSSSDISSQSRGLDMHMKVHWSAVASHVHEAEVWTPILSTGVKSLRTIEWNTPVELKVRADSQKVEITLMRDQQQQQQQERTKFFGMHTLPLTFTRTTDMETQNKREARVKSVQDASLEHAQREFRGDEQRAVQIEGHYHQLSTPAQMLHALYTTENNVHVYLTPRAARELTLRISGASFEAHKSHSKPEYSQFYGQQAFKSIYEQDEEQQDEDDQQREKSLNRYSQNYNGQQSGYKHQLRIEAIAKYEQQTDRIMTEIKGGCDAKMSHCKVFLNAERSPSRAQQETEPWTLKAKLQTIMPEIVRDNEEMNEERQSRMLIKLDSEWGNDNMLNMRVQAEPARNTQWQGESAQKVRFLNKLDAHVNYKLRPTTQQYAKTVWEMIKARNFWLINAEQRRSQEGVVRATIVVDPITRRHANISVQTPQERIRVEGMEVPTTMLAATYFPLDRRQSQYKSLSHVVSDFAGFDKAECRVNDRRVRTFDGVAYRAPLTECYSVIATERSESPRFAVLMKKTEEEKRVKIVTKQTVIELARPESGNERIKVIVDGKQVRDEQQLSEQGIQMSGDRVYVTKRGLEVIFDGELKIKLDSTYKNVASGICGHYDDEQSNDLSYMPNNERSQSLKEFHKSFQLTDDCDAKRMNSFYAQKNDDDFDMSSERQRDQSRRRYTQGNRRSEWFESDEQDQDDQQQQQQQQQQNGERRQGEDSWMRSDEQQDLQNIKPVEKTEVIEYSHKICFSMEPLRQCPRGTSADDEAKKQPKKAQFFCLERSSSEAKRLLRQARRGAQIDNQGRQPSFVETIEQPTKCVAY